MAVIVRIILNNQTLSMDSIRLDVLKQIKFVLRLSVRDSIISNDRIGQGQNLTGIAGISERFSVTLNQIIIQIRCCIGHQLRNYPTSPVLNTISPGLDLLAPNEYPWNDLPFFSTRLIFLGFIQLKLFKRFILKKKIHFKLLLKLDSGLQLKNNIFCLLRKC